MFYNEGFMDVNSSNTILTFTAPSPQMFRGDVKVTVAAMNSSGIGPTSDPVTAEIFGNK